MANRHIAWLDQHLPLPKTFTSNKEFVLTALQYCSLVLNAVELGDSELAQSIVSKNT